MGEAGQIMRYQSEAAQSIARETLTCKCFPNQSKEWHDEVDVNGNECGRSLTRYHVANPSRWLVRRRLMPDGIANDVH